LRNSFWFNRRRRAAAERGEVRGRLSPPPDRNIMVMDRLHSLAAFFPRSLNSGAKATLSDQRLSVQPEPAETHADNAATELVMPWRKSAGMLSQMSQMITIRPGCGAGRHQDRRGVIGRLRTTVRFAIFASSHRTPPMQLPWPGNRISGAARAARKFKGPLQCPSDQWWRAKRPARGKGSAGAFLTSA
jgi:hypothetical protein